MNKKRSYRKKRDEDEEDDIDVSASIDDRKELQKFRSRPKGVSVEVLASLLDTVSQNKEKTNDDPFKLNSGGGLVDNGKSRDLSNFGTNFSTETNQRDEDKQLLKYIEEGLMKKRGVNQQENPDTKVLSKEDLLYQLPENLKVQSKIMKSEEMLSSQVLCGIPEVDLGIEAKIKNIEATEEAKMKMIEESKNRKQQASEFVPTNMASNFMHHSRFYDEKKAIEKEKKEEKERLENAVVVDKGPTVGGDIIENVEDSKFIRNTMSSGGKRNKKGTSDDFMFESFKKRAREGKWSWRKTRSLTTDSNEDSTVVRHVVIREVWLKKHPWPHAVYKVEVMSQTSHWFVFKRYKEFYNLHQKLVALYNIPRNLLPPRILTNNMARETLQQRRELLEHYLQKLLNSCNGAVRKSEEISEFLEVKSNDISNVTYGLACYLKENGDSILMSKDYFRLSPSQLYCITKQLQMPHPNSTVDLGYLYQFVAALSRLSITDPATQFCNGEEHESFLTFDLSLFSSLTRLQIDACNINSIRGFESLCQKLKKLTARYCLSSMKTLLIDAAVEKRSTPQVNLLGEIWRVQAAYKLSENRLIVQSWYSLTHINFSHNQITTLDSSMTYLTSLEKLDLSYNLITHLDLQLATSPCLHTLSLSNNRIYLISASTQPIDKLKNLNLSYNKVQAIGGLLSCQGLVSLNISFNGIVEISEAKKLASLPYLSKLEVAGVEFLEKKGLYDWLILDKKSATAKEQAKVDAKFLALENFDDIDDSISTMDDDISTMSNENDSGYEQSIMRSHTQALKSSKHSESSVSSVLSSLNSTAISSNSDMFTQNEELSRADWDRILNKNMPISDEIGEYNISTRTAENIVNKTELKSKTISLSSKTENSDNTSVCESLKSNRSWVKNLFRKKADHVLPEINQLNISNTNEVFTPEINVVEVDKKYVSRSFDDNCDFEKAEECKEE